MSLSLALLHCRACLATILTIPCHFLLQRALGSSGCDDARERCRVDAVAEVRRTREAFLSLVEYSNEKQMHQGACTRTLAQLRCDLPVDHLVRDVQRDARGAHHSLEAQLCRSVLG